MLTPPKQIFQESGHLQEQYFSQFASGTGPVLANLVDAVATACERNDKNLKGLQGIMQNFTPEHELAIEVTSTAIASDSLHPGTGLDTEDDDIVGHIALFLHSVGQTLKLSDMNLNTTEDSQRALAAINGLQKKVQAHRHTAQVLKQLVVKQYADAGAPTMALDSSKLH